MEIILSQDEVHYTHYSTSFLSFACVCLSLFPSFFLSFLDFLFLVSLIFSHFSLSVILSSFIYRHLGLFLSSCFLYFLLYLLSFHISFISSSLFKPAVLGWHLGQELKTFHATKSLMMRCFTQQLDLVLCFISYPADICISFFVFFITQHLTANLWHLSKTITLFFLTWS